jgi:DNA-binding transcriptional regulator/RsmH inhibitor MraZ
MYFLSSDENISHGFCWGRYETAIDTESRIRLNKGIVLVLKEQKVTQLWRFPDPTGIRLILCPPENRLTYVKTAKENFPKSEKLEVAFRKYISPGEPATFDGQGRLILTSACIEHLKIDKNRQMLILGVGLWYEVWHYDRWIRDIHRSSEGTQK